MPDVEENKTVDIDTSGPDVDVQLEEPKEEKIEVEEIKEEPKVEEPKAEEKQENKKEEPIEELEQYSEGVKKRIAKLTKKWREAERQREAALEFAKGGQTELETLKQLATLSQNAGFLEKFPDILDNITSALARLFNTDYNINNFKDAMGELTSGIIDFQTNAVEPCTTAAVGETAVGLATGAEAAGGAAMAPVINNVVTNSTSPTQVVPDSNIGSRSFDRDVFSPLDNHSPYKFSGL